MNIWILNQYASLPADGIGGRHRHLARELCARGHSVTVVASRVTHLTRDVAAARGAPDMETFEGFRFLRLDLLHYPHAQDPRRILNWFLFALLLLRLPQRLRQRPDVILYSSPSLIGYLSAERLARRTGARLVFEVRDIWPLTLTAVGNHSPSHPFIRLLQWIEDRAYRTADHIISNLEGAGEHAVARGMDPAKFDWIPNGMSAAELGAPSPAGTASPAFAPIGKFVVGYAGTIGKVYALDTVVQAARLLGRRESVLFALVGTGSERSRLEAQVRTLGLQNIVFLDPVPKSQVQVLLKSFDACLMTWNSSKLYDFGIAANKLFDYFYASKPVIHCYSGRYDPVATYRAGITVEAENPHALAEAVLEMQGMSDFERARMGANGRREALERHEYVRIAARLESVLQLWGRPL